MNVEPLPRLTPIRVYPESFTVAIIDSEMASVYGAGATLRELQDLGVLTLFKPVENTLEEEHH